MWHLSWTFGDSPAPWNAPIPELLSPQKLTTFCVLAYYSQSLKAVSPFDEASGTSTWGFLG